MNMCVRPRRIKHVLRYVARRPHRVMVRNHTHANINNLCMCTRIKCVIGHRTREIAGTRRPVHLLWAITTSPMTFHHMSTISVSCVRHCDNDNVAFACVIAACQFMRNKHTQKPCANCGAHSDALCSRWVLKRFPLGSPFVRGPVPGRAAEICLDDPGGGALQCSFLTLSDPSFLSVWQFGQMCACAYRDTQAHFGWSPTAAPRAPKRVIYYAGAHTDTHAHTHNLVGIVVVHASYTARSWSVRRCIFC